MSCKPLHWPIERAISHCTRLPCGPIWAARIAAAKCLQWPTFLMNCLNRWAQVGQQQPVKMSCKFLHWPIEPAMNCCMKLLHGPIWAARIAAVKCSQWPTFLMMCLNRWAQVGQQQLVKMLYKSLHWPIEPAMNCCTKLPCGPTWAARMAAAKCLQWPMFLMNCLNRWAQVGQQQPVRNVI